MKIRKKNLSSHLIDWKNQHKTKLNLQLDIWSHLSVMETHWPSLQVKDPEPQEVTFTLITLESEYTVQGSSFTRETSNSCSPNNMEISEE